MADWVKDQNLNNNFANLLLRKADSLRKTIDYSILTCYKEGRYPNLIERKIVSIKIWNINRIWNNRKSYKFNVD